MFASKNSKRSLYECLPVMPLGGYFVMAESLRDYRCMQIKRESIYAEGSSL